MVKELTKITIDAFRKSEILQANITKAYIQIPGDKRIHRNPYNRFVAHKVDIILGNLQQKQIQLIFIIRQQVKTKN